MKKYAVIVAGGSGTRMQSHIPKQFLEISGKPLLWYTVNTFLKAYDDLQIILVLPKENEFDLSGFGNEQKRILIVFGGETRFHSVKNGLSIITKDEPSVIFVHDGVRCAVSVALIQRCYEEAIQYGSAVPAVVSQDSVRITENNSNRIFDRNNVRLIQTPQTFLSDIVLPAFQAEYQEVFTDEASVAEAAGHQIHLTEGEYTNIKVTRPTDLYTAEKFLFSDK